MYSVFCHYIYRMKSIFKILLIVGLLISEVNDGLVLISDFSINRATLIDNNQDVINFWELNDHNFLMRLNGVNF